MSKKSITIKTSIAVIGFILAFILLKEDFVYFIRWWGLLFITGFICLPLTSRLFHSFYDNGYLFSKVIGIAIGGYLMWLFASLKILKFNIYSCLILFSLMILFNFLLYKKWKLKKRILEKWNTYFTLELGFFIFLLIAVFIRGFKPEAYGTEKFMDYGFMTSMMNSQYMPPQDFWFAGNSLNYYYLGQFIATFLSKLSVVPVSHGYNLMLMTLASLSFFLSFSLVFNISRKYFIDKRIDYKYSPYIAGILSGAGISFAGNMHFTIFYWLVPIIQEILGIASEKKYWFSDSTRYIGYHPETGDKTIHEFPSYSFILGDLHAHVLNIIFVLTLMGILYAWLVNYKKIHWSNYKGKKPYYVFKEIIQPDTIMIGFFIGLFHMTNFWDFPIYFVVSGAVILFTLIRHYGFSKESLLITSINAIVVIVISELVALPFTRTFDQISSNILRTNNHTPIYQLIILWGLFFIIVIAFITELIQTYKMTRLLKDNKTNQSFIVDFFRTIALGDLFILILGLCAIGLVFIPELIYVEDIYSGDYKRANTMFKLTYQAFIMFGICSGFIFIKFFKAKRYLWQKKLAIVTFLLFVSTLLYTPVAVKGWYGDIRKIENYKGLDSSLFLKEKMPEDYRGIEWIIENIERNAIILEANGDSYSDYQRISVFTGNPTVLGWYVHEWLWRGDPELIDERSFDIETIYTSYDKDKVMHLIDKYKIDYIYVGKLEYEKYEEINHQALKSLGNIVYSSKSYSENEFETYIIEVE